MEGLYNPHEHALQAGSGHGVVTPGGGFMMLANPSRPPHPSTHKKNEFVQGAGNLRPILSTRSDRPTPGGGGGGGLRTKLLP